MNGTDQPPLVADVVIVNWNTGDYLRDCLRSIARADRSVLAVGVVVVVDNASVDGSADGLDIPGLRLRLIRNDLNRGFAAACNQGAALCDADYLLFLNPDTRVYPDALRAVGDFLRTETARRVGICGARIVDEQGRTAVSCSRFPTLRVVVATMTGFGRLSPGLFPSHHLRSEEIASSRPVDQVIGAFYLVRRPLFVELEGFDDRFFLYFEEVDFALRASRNGWASYFLGDALVYHAEHVSSDKARGRGLRHLLCSRTLYAFLHWPHRDARLLIALTLLLELPGRIVRAGIRGSGSEIRDTAVAYGGYVRWLLQERTRRDYRMLTM
ncbi:glycosyltransferase family 2 protein [Streptomyces sp. NPDC047072]|uniref:glycosyltransferase family 2 protein n=1 Tax=Streptomyces sp. NPDC047072 TaxID=3154809 RepID=UPI0033C10171